MKPQRQRHRRRHRQSHSFAWDAWAMASAVTLMPTNRSSTTKATIHTCSHHSSSPVSLSFCLGLIALSYKPKFKSLGQGHPCQCANPGQPVSVCNCISFMCLHKAYHPQLIIMQPPTKLTVLPADERWALICIQPTTTDTAKATEARATAIVTGWQQEATSQVDAPVC